MHKYLMCLLLVLSIGSSSTYAQAENNMIKLSQDFLTALKNKKSTEDYKNILAQVDLKDLSSQLDNDDKRLAFWINIYNAFIMDILNKAPEKYQDRSNFFKEKQMIIAGKEVSFDDIEHGVIRSSVIKLSLGYLSKWFVSDWERKLRTKKRNYRIHFALNCGAKSCPPVAIYDDKTVNQDLEKISKQFVTNASAYDAEKNTVVTSPLMSWFRGDFGGKTGVKKILKQHEVIPSTKVDLEFGPYDWTLFLFNFTTI